MSPRPGIHQLGFDGREVTGRQVDLAALGKMPLQDLLGESGIEDLASGDWVRIELWAHCEGAFQGAKVDKDDGVEKEGYGATYYLKPLRTALRVTQRLTKKERDERWAAAQEAG